RNAASSPADSTVPRATTVVAPARESAGGAPGWTPGRTDIVRGSWRRGDARQAATHGTGDRNAAARAPPKPGERFHPRKDRTRLLTMRVRGIDELTNWVLGLGPHVQVPGRCHRRRNADWPPVIWRP